MYPPPQPPKRRKVWPWIVLAFTVPLVGLVLLGVVVVAVNSGTRPTTKPTVEVPKPRTEIILAEKPGSGPPATFQGTPLYTACSVLTHDVVEAAGLRYSDAYLLGGTRLSPDGDRPSLVGTGIDAGNCGGVLDVEAAGASPILTLQLSHAKFSENSTWRYDLEKAAGQELKTANGVKYFRQELQTPGDIEVVFDSGDGYNRMALSISRFAALPDSEATLVKLIDGVSRNIAAGPKPMPEHSYPEPYNLVAKPCDAFTPEVFMLVTGKKTDGLQRETFSQRETAGSLSNVVDMDCDREAPVVLSEGIAPSLSVLQTLFATEAAAAKSTRDDCDYQKTKHALPQPIGEVSCGEETQVVFSQGRIKVLLSLVAPPPNPKVFEGAQKVYALLPQ